MDWKIMPRIACAWIIVTALFIMGCASGGQHHARKHSDPQELKTQLEQIAQSFHGVLGYSVHHLGTGDTFEYRADELFPTASTIKVAMMVEALRQNQDGLIGYYDTKEYEEKFKRTGAGFIQNFQFGTKIEFKELLHLMITVSDNAATVMLADWLTNEAVNKRMEALGLHNTWLLPYLKQPDANMKALNEKYGLGVTTPHEMRLLMEKIVSGEAGTPAATDEMQRLLAHQYFDDVNTEFPPSVMVLCKSGSISNSRSMVVYVFAPTGAFCFTVYTRENQDTSWGKQNEADMVIKTVARTIWNHYNSDSGYTPPPGVDKF